MGALRPARHLTRKKKLRDIVIPLSEYPHLPYWANLGDAIVRLNVAFETGYDTVLVFDDRYKLVGTLAQKDILRGIEPKFAQHYGQGVPIFWDRLFESGSRIALARPIKEFMSKVTVSVDAGDDFLKASHILLHERACVLPVSDGGELIGVVTMEDLFQQITGAVLRL